MEKTLEHLLRAEIGRIAKRNPEEIDLSCSLGELGFDSLGYAELTSFIQGQFRVPLKLENLFEHSSIYETQMCITRLGEGRTDKVPPQTASNSLATYNGIYGERDVAIIGASARLPGVADLESLWDLVEEGKSKLSIFPSDRAATPDHNTTPPSFLRGGFIEDVDAFDASFFGISPREALAMDPQQRISLEAAWHAFEDAGYRVERLSGSDTSVFVGASSFDYFELLTITNRARTTHIGTGVSHAVIPNRISQYFNLKGASETIDAACASSLVAIIRGVNAIRSGESRLVLAGGVNVLASPTPFQIFADAGMLSQDGVCRPFDDAAAGYVRGEGAAFVVLKQVRAALQDGDRILAIVKGAAVRHSGRTQSLTAPNPEAQADVITAALEDAGVDPASIGYIEAHGTGTELGDPIEIQGLRKAFSRLHEKWGRRDVTPHGCIGSIKAQIGHLEAAAGVAGVLKAISALAHQAIPGNPYLKQINRYIELDDMPFRIPQRTLPWSGIQADVNLQHEPRRAGISSFGFGGTNAHIVIEAAPPPTIRSPAQAQLHLFVLSAKNMEALRVLCSRLVISLSSRNFTNPNLEAAYLEDVAFTLRHGRSPLSSRLTVLASTLVELVTKLSQFVQGNNDGSGIYVGEVLSASRKAKELSSGGVPKWAQRSGLMGQYDLGSLALEWVQGASIDWDQVVPRGNAMLMALPLYPFVRDRFWVHNAAIEQNECVMPQEANAVPTTGVLYHTHWVPAPIQQTDSASLEGMLLALIAGPRGQQVADAVKNMTAANRMQVVLVPQDTNSTIPTPDSSSARFGAVLDLTPLDEDAYLRLNIAYKLEVLRQLIGNALKRGELIKIVHVTCGSYECVQDNIAPSTLAGAQDAGFYEHLSAEYKRCQSKILSFPRTVGDTEVLATQLVSELLHHDGNHALAYIGGQRYARRMKRIDYPLSTDECSLNINNALITGGTGDIGLVLARDLVEHGCRALLLTGRTALSPDKSAIIKTLEQLGARVVFYRGELTDAEALVEAIDKFRAAYGHITHVFHCAGAVDKLTPAFFQKTAGSIAKVMAPKVSALQVLHNAFQHDPPQAFILFSSLSSIVPSLAAGILDYAAANRFLDIFASYQHVLGHTYYRSIQWPRWEGLGLARNVGSADAQMVRAMSASACLNVLHAVLTAGDALPPSLCVVAGNDTVLETSHPHAATRPVSDHTKVNSLTQYDTKLESLLCGLRTLVAKELEMPESKLDVNTSFQALGIDSIVLMGLIVSIEKWLGIVVEPQELINRNSISGVAHYLETRLSTHTPSRIPVSVPDDQVKVSPQNDLQRRFIREKIAVIGMACHFPGAPDKKTFWNNLIAGIDSVGMVPSSRWNNTEIYSSSYKAGRSISQWGGFISDIEWVNPKLFGISDEEAKDIDPLVRLFTECGLSAADDSVQGVDGLKGRRVGVFVGARAGGYGERIEQPGKHSITGIGQNFIAAHISHLLDLRGPSLVVDSACSSSLAAIHLACQSLFSGDSEVALAGGVEVLLDEKPYLFLSAARALSPDGRCRPFDAKANGFVPGEGVGCVLLKPLNRALADSDRIYAVIEGSAMNNDGHTLGITTPGVAGQADVIEHALYNANVSPCDISYVEAHGTGTLIGDPIELQSLTRAFQANPPKRCAIGSVKSNVGHLLSAAGIASFIKVALALHHETLPPSVNCDQLNPRFAFESTPFYVPCVSQKWNSEGGLRHAGISSFGFGKTNVHMVLGERPTTARKPLDPDVRLSDSRKMGRIEAWYPSRLHNSPQDNSEVAGMFEIKVEVFEES